MVQSPSTLHVQGLMIRHEFWGELCPIRLNSLRGQINFLYHLHKGKNWGSVLICCENRGIDHAEFDKKLHESYTRDKPLPSEFRVTEFISK